MDDHGQDFIPTFSEVEDDMMRAQAGILDPDDIEVELTPAPFEYFVPVTSGLLQRNST